MVEGAKDREYRLVLVPGKGVSMMSRRKNKVEYEIKEEVEREADVEISGGSRRRDCDWIIGLIILIILVILFFLIFWDNDFCF